MFGNRSSFYRFRIYLLTAVAGIAVGLLDYLLGIWMAAHRLRRDFTLLDELLLGIFTAALVFVIEFSHRRDEQRMNEKLRTIQLMNHHVRNALQNIIDSAYVHGHLDDIKISAERIGWALREILPGDTDANASLKAPEGTIQQHDAVNMDHPC
jgi:uncharacterized membrane protein YiaA